MKRPLSRRGCRAALALLLTALLCIAMNCAAFWIDTDRLRENAAQGTALLGEEGGTPQLIGGFKSSQPDNYTAIMILKTAAYTGPETLLQKALGGYRMDRAAAEGESAWYAYARYVPGDGGGYPYMRY